MTSLPIKIVTGVEPIRRRPSIYIGSVRRYGLHHMIDILLERSLASVGEDGCCRVEVELLADNGCRIVDNGPGIGEQWVNTERVFEELCPESLPFSIDHQNLVIVSALSSQFHLETSATGSRVRLEYARGRFQDKSTRLASPNEGGTSILYRLDPQIFPEPGNYDVDLLRVRMRELSYLHPKVELCLVDRRSEQVRSERFRNPGGLVDCVRDLNVRYSCRPRVDDVDETWPSVRDYHGITQSRQAREPVHANIAYVEGGGPDQQFQLAMQWTRSEDDLVVTFANRGPVISVGAHHNGLRRALKRVLAKYAEWYGSPAEEPIRTSDCWRGVTAALAMNIKNPEFQTATRERIHNPELNSVLPPAVDQWLAVYLECHPIDAAAIFERVRQSRDSRLRGDKAAK